MQFFSVNLMQIRTSYDSVFNLFDLFDSIHIQFPSKAASRWP